MTIKEAEKCTGLTAKSIRLYEAKGLISINRNIDNDYRDYSEENIEQLKKIKLLRYLDFSISDIKEIFDKKDNLFVLIDKKIDQYDELKSECDFKKSLCAELEKNIDNAEYIDVVNKKIDFAENDDVKELKRVVKDMSMPSLSGSLLQTAIGLGPVIATFVEMNNDTSNHLVISTLFAFIGVVLITYTWINYYNKRKLYKSNVKKKNMEKSYLIPAVIVSFVLSTVLMFFVGIVQEKLFATDGWLFMQMSHRAENYMIFMITVPTGLIVVYFSIRLLKNEIAIKLSKAFIAIITILWVVTFYCCFTSVNVVTEDRIIMHTPFNVSGCEYSYADVKEIKTGFSRKGYFYYTLCFNDASAEFTGGTVNSEIKRYNNDTYLELEELDNALMKLGTKKIANDKYIERCSFDKVFVERFERIIDNRN